jgi:hypothetical protein
MIFINEHEIRLDQNKRLEPWTSYDRVVSLAMDFIKRCPVEPHNQLPWYLQYSCFWTDPLRPAIWPDNPAGKFAWATTTLLKFYPYSGDAGFIPIIRSMLDRLWEYRTQADDAWPEVPYASAHPGTGIYFGARADGEYATETDKVAQAARAFVDFYEVTEEARYLEMGLTCARVLTTKLRDGDESHSPWPFRVNVRDGSVIEEYTSHIIPAVRLFDELIRLGYPEFQTVRTQVWDWIQTYPLQNNIWKGHFEDIRLDPSNGNRDQLSSLETARYILQHRNEVPNWQSLVKGLIDWVKETLGDHPFFAAIPIHEQKYCYFPMGSHTARYASLCALYAAATGDQTYREQAIRSFNWATYMANEQGWVVCGVDRPDYYNQCWFTDGYFDYVPHFLDGFAALPEMAPSDKDHMLDSTSVIQKIDYQPFRVAYRTFSPEGVQTLRLTFQPKQILVDKQLLLEIDSLGSGPGWYYLPENNTVKVQPAGREVEVIGRL